MALKTLWFTLQNIDTVCFITTDQRHSGGYKQAVEAVTGRGARGKGKLVTVLEGGKAVRTGERNKGRDRCDQVEGRKGREGCGVLQV